MSPELVYGQRCRTAPMALCRKNQSTGFTRHYRRLQSIASVPGDQRAVHICLQILRNDIGSVCLGPNQSCATTRSCVSRYLLDDTGPWKTIRLMAIDQRNGSSCILPQLHDEIVITLKPLQKMTAWPKACSKKSLLSESDK
ncbi:hypothetical protein BDR07DRAFT_1402313 [Suillus spraguei]|nr:hypothetical protein BDR07DRAFT_1402313 [Suillus spraguei]